MLEKNIQAKILKYLKTIPNSYFFKVAQGKFSQGGISDILGLYRGQFVAIEVKADGNKMTPLQARFQDIIKRSGGIAICAYSLEDVQQWIK